MRPLTAAWRMTWKATILAVGITFCAWWGWVIWHILTNQTFWETAGGLAFLLFILSVLATAHDYFSQRDM